MTVGLSRTQARSRESGMHGATTETPLEVVRHAIRARKLLHAENASPRPRRRGKKSAEQCSYPHAE